MQRLLQAERRNIYVLGFGASYIKRFYGNPRMSTSGIKVSKSNNAIVFDSLYFYSDLHILLVTWGLSKNACTTSRNLIMKRCKSDRLEYCKHIRNTRNCQHDTTTTTTERILQLLWITAIDRAWHISLHDGQGQVTLLVDQADFCKLASKLYNLFWKIQTFEGQAMISLYVKSWYTSWTDLLMA